VIVIVVPPVVRPQVGEIELIVGGSGADWNGSAFEVPPSVVTVTLIVPIGIVGVTNNTLVAVAEPTGSELKPKLTDVTVARFVPVIVTGVPPVYGPELGEIEVIVGGGGRYWNDSGFEVPPGVVSTTLAGPGLPAGVQRQRVPAFDAVTEVAATPPTVTEVVPARFTPEDRDRRSAVGRARVRGDRGDDRRRRHILERQ
jgi:hypothetical protein